MNPKQAETHNTVDKEALKQSKKKKAKVLKNQTIVRK